MPRRFRDSRSWITASTTKAPLLCQRIPVAAFSRGAGVLGIAPPTPKLNVFMLPLNTSEPHLQLLDGFAGQISPKRHPSSAFPLVGEADREHSPAENCAEVQSSWQNRRPFPAKPPRIRRGATAGKAAAAVSANAGAARSIAGGVRRRSRGSRCACSQTNPCTGCTANRRAKALMKSAGRAPYPPLQKATLIHPRQPAKKVTHNYQESPCRAVIPRFSIVKCRQQISHGNTVPCVAKPPQAIREVTP